MPRVRVVPLAPALGALDYTADAAPAPGTIVAIPLGPRTLAGVVWEPEHAPARDVPEAKLRPIGPALDAPPLAAPLRRLIDWIASYYIAPLGAALRLALPSTGALEAPAIRTGWRAATPPPPGLTARQSAALAALAALPPASLASFARQAGVGTATLQALARAGALVRAPLAAAAPPAPAATPRAPDLSPGQAAAAATLVAAVRARDPKPALLEGVTGSGKTEVYAEAIAAALADGGQALVLLPEIALTAPFIARFTRRFGAAPHVWHSALPSAQRRATWRAAAHGTAPLVVGARSALFLPFPDLRLIVVDEAHETAFKQDDGIPYHGRDAALMRARFERCAVVLATATPALETRAQADRGHYTRLTLPARHGGATLPTVTTIDLRRQPPPRGRWLSPPLVTAIDRRLAAAEQSLLFLNRRGFAPLTLCRECGERLGCPDCSAWLVEHRLTGRLLCHHCGYTLPTPPACPACAAPGALTPCGPGVERIAEECARLWPAARLAVATSDTLATPPRAAAFLDAMHGGAIDIVVGTQVMAKGHHFPGLTLVGIVDANLGLTGGDLRAAERTHAAITQAGGRAGRADRPGEVLMQSHDPSAPVLQALATGDTTAFYALETEARRAARMPPFTRLAALIVSALDPAAAEALARAIAAAAPPTEGIDLLGPAPAPLAMLRGRHRWRLLARAHRRAPLQDYLRTLLAKIKVPGSARVSVDVDPYNFN